MNDKATRIKIKKLFKPDLAIYPISSKEIIPKVEPNFLKSDTLEYKLLAKEIVRHGKCLVDILPFSTVFSLRGEIYVVAPPMIRDYPQILK